MTGNTSPYPLQDVVIQNICYEVVFGHRDQQRLAEEHGACGTPDMFGVTLPEIDGQVHPLAVLLLHLVPAAIKTQRQRSRFFIT